MRVRPAQTLFVKSAVRDREHELIGIAREPKRDWSVVPMFDGVINQVGCGPSDHVFVPPHQRLVRELSRESSIGTVLLRFTELGGRLDENVGNDV
jgi:hypothetical protein